MIAKNVGIRRARGRFMLATNIDIIFSNELVDWLASGPLEPQLSTASIATTSSPTFPATLRSRADGLLPDPQIRVHTRAGTHAVDPLAGERCSNRHRGRRGGPLGSGWHVREGDAKGRVLPMGEPGRRFSRSLNGMAPHRCRAPRWTSTWI